MSGQTNSTMQCNAHLLVVRARSPDPNSDVSISELFRVLLERRDYASERGRHVREVGNSSSDDKDLSATRSTTVVNRAISRPWPNARDMQNTRKQSILMKVMNLKLVSHAATANTTNLRFLSSQDVE